jgi:hypothetical protein
VDAIGDRMRAPVEGGDPSLGEPREAPEPPEDDVADEAEEEDAPQRA